MTDSPYLFGKVTDAATYYNKAMDVFLSHCSGYYREFYPGTCENVTNSCLTRDTPERCLDYVYDRASGVDSHCILRRGHRSRHSDGCLGWFCFMGDFENPSMEDFLPEGFELHKEPLPLQSCCKS